MLRPAVAASIVPCRRLFSSHVGGGRSLRPLSSRLPPPEWIEPSLDVSDLARPSGPLHPSPWLPRVLSLVLSAAALEPELDAFCRRFLVRLSPAFVARALRPSPDLLAAPPRALRFFRWAATQPGYSHSLPAYAAIISLLCSASDPAAARQLVAELRDSGLPLTPSATSPLTKALGAAGLVEELLWVWRRSKECGAELPLASYNCLLDALVSSGFVDAADRVFDAMISSGKPDLRPDVISYNTLIKGYCRAGRACDAMSRLGDMPAAGLRPDKITYLTLIQRHYSDAAFQECLSLYHAMVEAGIEVPPHAYSLIVAGLCKDGKPFEGLAVLDDMARRGDCKPSVGMHTALIDSFAKSGNGCQAMLMFDRMKAQGLEPDEVTYGVVINCLCKAGKVEEATSWFDYCKEKGVAVNVIFYSSLIDGYGKAGVVEEAKRFFQEMVEKGFMPDSYCYNALMDALCKAGRIDEALNLFKRMEEDGCNQTVYTYTILIDGMFRKHKNEEALKLWDAMIDKGISPTPASFRTLSTGLCLSGKFNRACKILDELAPMGVVPETAHEDMLNVLCKAGRFDHACKLADGIIDKGREIPGRVRTVMINALRKVGNAELAMKLLHSKIGIGYDRIGSIKRRVKFRTLLDTTV